MRPIAAPLQAHLDTRATTMCFCWSIIRRDGVIMGFTDHDEDVMLGLLNCEASTSFNATAIEDQLGLAVSNMDVNGALGMIKSHSIREEDILARRFDGAKVTLYRVNWADPTQFEIVRTGFTGNVSRGDLAFTVELRGLAQVYDQQIGALSSPKCRSRFGDQGKGLDGGCRMELDPPAWTVTTDFAAGKRTKPTTENGFVYQAGADGTTGSVEPAWPEAEGGTVVDGSITWTAKLAISRTAKVVGLLDRSHFFVGHIQGSVPADRGGTENGGFFMFGTVKFTSGENAGVSTEITAFHAGSGSGESGLSGTSGASSGAGSFGHEVVCFQAFPFDIAIGDELVLTAGCDKLSGTCLHNWDNFNNRRAEDHLPGPDFVLKVHEAS